MILALCPFCSLAAQSWIASCSGFLRSRRPVADGFRPIALRADVMLAARISPLMSTQNPNSIPHEPDDPIPNPEPASPSLDEPDPGVFHHDPRRPPSNQPPACTRQGFTRM